MFTIGHAITIAICLGLIMLFRYADKNNRSLEKLRRFGDRQKEDFAEFIDSKMKNFENISVDIGVTIDRAGAALAALRDADAKLSQKAEKLTALRKEISEVAEKIARIERTVSELAAAVAGADKNLEKVAEFSQFADSMTRKVQDARDGLEAVFSQIEGLEQRFSEENAAALSAAREEVLAEIRSELAGIQESAEKAARTAEEAESQAQENLQKICEDLFSKAAGRAERLEDQVFERLRQEAAGRLEQYKQAVEASAQSLLQQTKERLAESQRLVQGFRAEWEADSDAMMKKAQSELRAFAESTREECRKIKSDQEDFFEERQSEQEEFFQKIKAETEGIAEASARATGNAERQLVEIDGKLAGFVKESSGQFARLRDLLNELPLIDSRIQASINEIEEKSSSALELFVQEQTTRRDRFEAAFDVRSESLMGKIQNLENAISELKTHAYANVSEKIKIFEDDFFSDLKERADTMTAEMNSWQSSVEQRLSAISAETEALRANTEAECAEALRSKLAVLEESYREQAEKAEARLREVEKEMREKLDENSADVQSFTEQYRADFQKARENAEAFARRELQMHSASIQESLRVQHLEIETRYKELMASLGAERESAEAAMNGIRESIFDWQRKNEKAAENANYEIEAKIADFKEASSDMIANVQASAQSEFSAAIAKLGSDTENLRASLDELQEKIEGAGEALDKKSREALERFSKMFNELSKKADERARQSREELDNTVVSLKVQGMEITSTLEEARQKLFKKMQNDTDSLSESIEEVAAKQRAFVEQTRIFSRADELKASLESSIEKLKIEAGNLAVYEEEMTRLKSYYRQIREMSDEAEEKVASILNEKRRIDTIESDFSLLLDASAKTAEKVAEMTRTRDEVLDYQARLRRFEETIEKVSERYDRIERKSLTIDQTLVNADKAFDSLKELEKSLKEFRERSASMPADLEAIQSKFSVLLDSSERVGEIESKITQLESELSDAEKRSRRIQDDRQSFINMEKRLVSLKAEVDKNIGLFRTLSRSDTQAYRKEDGAPSFERRAYVKDLKHKNWTVDEIAQNMKMSKAEVELILDEPD